jgi:hypothetical protein
MLLYRSLTTGLLGACILLLVELLARTGRTHAAPIVIPIAAPSLRGLDASPTIIDVSAAVPASELGALVPLAAGERVLAVGDVPMPSDLAAGAAIAARTIEHGHYLDLTVGDGVSAHRVLLLRH